MNGTLGPIFWGSRESPTVFEGITRTLNIPNLKDMDSQTQHDITPLTSTTDNLCSSSLGTSAAAATGTTKCEFCAGGCQLYDSIDKSLGIANERTHWVLPSSNNSKGRDVILYRADVHRFYSSVRSWSDGNPPTQQDWSSPQVHF